MYKNTKIKFSLIILLIMSYLNTFCQSKIYEKKYFENGQIESEGWIQEDQKIDYWYFYYENGNKKEEGHFTYNKKTKWWLSYDDNEILQKKCQFYNDKLEGLVIIYRNGSIIRAEKYKMNMKIKQWETISAFRKDNTLTSL